MHVNQVSSTRLIPSGCGFAGVKLGRTQLDVVSLTSSYYFLVPTVSDLLLYMNTHEFYDQIVLLESL